MTEPESRRRFLHRAARLGLSAAGLMGLAGCGTWSPPAGPASTGKKVHRIGLLTGGPLETDALAEFLQRLREHGWVEGENIAFVYRAGAGTPRLGEQAAELAKLPVDLLVVAGNPAAREARNATRTIPIVMSTSTDPVGAGFAASLARPSGNLTGMIGEVTELDGKRLELLVDAVPGISRVALLGSPSQPPDPALRETARSLGVELHYVVTGTAGGETIDAAFEAARGAGADALLIRHNGTTNTHADRIAALAAAYSLPAMYSREYWIEPVGLMVYTASIPRMYRRAADYVDKILRGANPADLPLEQPTQFDLTINLKTASALGITIPDSLLAQASEVIR